MKKQLQTFTVYVLYSDKFRKHYTGYTSYLELRLQQHFETATRGWTVRYRPWKLIFTKEFTCKAEALRYEKWLKTGVGRDFIKKLKH